MKSLFLPPIFFLVAALHAEPLRLILVPKQVVLLPGAPATEFDLFLYNSGNSAQTAPSLESFRAHWLVRRHGDSNAKSGTEIRAYSQSIKDHTLKAFRTDHTVIDIDLSSEDGDYIELWVVIGHDEHTLTSNSVLLLKPPGAEPRPSPQPGITPNS